MAKTTKVINIGFGGCQIEVILNIDKNPKTFSVYRRVSILHNEDAEYPYHTRSRRKIKECQYLVEVLEFITNYFKTGEWNKEV